MRHFVHIPRPFCVRIVLFQKNLARYTPPLRIGGSLSIQNAESRVLEK